MKVMKIKQQIFDYSNSIFYGPTGTMSFGEFFSIVDKQQQEIAAAEAEQSAPMVTIEDDMDDEDDEDDDDGWRDDERDMDFELPMSRAEKRARRRMEQAENEGLENLQCMKTTVILHY